LQSDFIQEIGNLSVYTIAHSKNYVIKEYYECVLSSESSTICLKHPYLSPSTNAQKESHGLVCFNASVPFMQKEFSNIGLNPENMVAPFMLDSVGNPEV
jgi:hypothetical protein